MTATRLSYSISGEAARAKTDALIRGEITPSTEAIQLIESLESRLERRRSSDSFAATKHFLQSLKTPNEELRIKNAFDHAEIYRKLPPAERDFVYQRAVLQKGDLEERIFNAQSHEQLGKAPISAERIPVESADALRGDLKEKIVGLLKGGSEVSEKELVERKRRVLEKNLGPLVSERNGDAGIRDMSREFASNVSDRFSRDANRFIHPDKTQQAPRMRLAHDSLLYETSR